MKEVIEGREEIVNKMRNRFIKRWKEGWREGGKKEEDI